MYELIRVNESTYYIDSPTKIGIYKLNDSDVCLIDSGNDKEAGRKVVKILEENKWTLKIIINTHSNADHVGGNKYLQEKTKCAIYSTVIENSFISSPILESSFLYGGYPVKELQNKFLMAKESIPKDIEFIDFNGNLEIIPLKGHYFGMIGVKTKDNVYFLGDSIFGESIINKYHIIFIYDVKEFLNTLDYLDTLEGTFYIPSHSKATNNIKDIVSLNRNKTYEIISKILDICKDELCFEDILKEIFNLYTLEMNMNQYVLVGSTIKSYLSYLHNEDKIEIIFKDNKLLWRTI